MGDEVKSPVVFASKRSVALALYIALAASQVYAAEWDVSKGASLSLQEVYSDNANRSSTGEEARFFTQLSVTPNFKVKGKGSRARLDLDGSLGFRAGDGTTRSFVPLLNGKGNLELVRKHLFLDANVIVRENVVDPYGDIALDDVVDNGNTTITYQYGLSPYFKTRIPEVGTLLARYEFSGTSHAESGATGSNDNSFNVSLDTASSASRFSWGLSTDYRRSEYADDEERDYLSTDVNLGFRVNRQWSMRGSLGREWNDYPSTESTIGGFRWTLDSIWTPNPRASLRVGYGGRYFGSTPTLDFSYKSRRSTIAVGYARSVTDSNSQLASLATDPVTGQVFPVAVLSNDVYIDERLTASYSLEGKHTTLILSGTQSKQDYENSPRDSELASLGLSLGRSLTGSVSANAGLLWNQQDRAANDSGETWQANLGLNVKLGPKTSLNLTYTYNRRDDAQPSDSYEENRASLALSYSL